MLIAKSIYEINLFALEVIHIMFSTSHKMHFNFSLTGFSEKMQKTLKYLNCNKKIYMLEKFAIFIKADQYLHGWDFLFMSK